MFNAHNCVLLIALTYLVYGSAHLLSDYAWFGRGRAMRQVRRICKLTIIATVFVIAMLYALEYLLSR